MRDPSVGDAVDRVLVTISIVVPEVIPTGCRQIERPGHEARHLRTRHETRRAETRASAAVGHIGSGDTVDPALMLARAVVGEVIARGPRQLECPGQEGCHLIARDRTLGAEGVITATDRYPPLGDPHDVVPEVAGTDVPERCPVRRGVSGTLNR